MALRSAGVQRQDRGDRVLSGRRLCGDALGARARVLGGEWAESVRKLAITRSNQVRALDTIYIRMARGFVYLTAVVDVASRRVLAHRVAITLEAIHAKEVIEQAMLKYGCPEIVN